MVKKITSFTHHTTQEGERITFSYSLINDNGTLAKSNERMSIIILDNDIIDMISEISKYLEDKIQE